MSKEYFCAAHHRSMTIPEALMCESVSHEGLDGRYDRQCRAGNAEKCSVLIETTLPRI